MFPKGGLYSKTPSAGVLHRNKGVPPFAPTDITGMQMWFKADTGLFTDSAKTTAATTNGDRVGAWADQSGNGNDLLQTTDARRPLLTAAGLNGHSFISNSTNNEYMVKAVLNIAQPYTWFIVSRMSTLTTGNYFYTNSKGNLSYESGGGKFYLSNGATVLGQVATTNWTYHTGVCTTSTSTIRNNGVETSGATPGGTMTLMSIMASDGGFGASTASAAHFAEILLYTGALSAANILKVEAYLASRFGL